MNKTKSSNPVRLIAFFLTAFLLICTFGFTADGWQICDEANGNGTTGNPSDIPTTPDTDRPPFNQDAEVPDEPEIYIPEFINRITGEEVNEKASKSAHLAFVMDSALQCYGISGADMICELPTENGGTRMIAFVPKNERLWKIGSLASTRGYISNIIKYFGGICISSGKDDRINYNQCDLKEAQIDLSLHSGYHYTEFTNNLYTNSDLLSSGIEDCGIDTEKIPAPTLPYDFLEFGKEPIIYEDALAKSVTIKQSNTMQTQLQYDEESGKYFIFKNGNPLTDGTNGKHPEFENCFILFADSVTYDNSQCSQMVMDTIGSGAGYYFTRGGACVIKWCATAEGVIDFTLPDGERLTVNRGNVYLSFQKSSMIDKIIFE